MHQGRHRKLFLGIARWSFGIALLLSAAGTSPSAREPKDLADHFFTSQDEPLTEYRAYRRIHASSEHFGQEGWLEAWTELDQHSFRYTVVSESGSDYMRNKVLKAILEREQKLVADGEDRRSQLTPDNYEFEDAAHGDRERYVRIKPRRKDVLLVDGRMVLSQDSGELLRVEGKLSKNPSFWTSLVNVIRRYARLDGVRVPISTDSVAKVKFAGEAHLDDHYEYVSINGRPLSLAARRVLSRLSAR